MQKERHGRLGEYAAETITIAKVHGVSVDDLMCTVADVKAELGQSKGWEPSSSAERAACDALLAMPALGGLSWWARELDPVEQAELRKQGWTEANDERVKKKLEALELERAKKAEARELELLERQAIARAQSPSEEPGSEVVATVEIKTDPPPAAPPAPKKRTSRRKTTKRDS